MKNVKDEWHRLKITKELVQLLVVSTILPKLDYCNSTLNSIPQYSIKRLNSLQYSAARTIFRIKKYSRMHMTPYLKSLHWLPISQRINYNILLQTHHATHNNTPDYLTELLTEYNSSRLQRTSNTFKLQIPYTTKLICKQESAFSIIPPKLWNNLPYKLSCLQSTSLFKCRIKTHLFNIAYPNQHMKTRPKTL